MMSTAALFCTLLHCCTLLNTADHYSQLLTLLHTAAHYSKLVNVPPIWSKLLTTSLPNTGQLLLTALHCSKLLYPIPLHNTPSHCFTLLHTALMHIDIHWSTLINTPNTTHIITPWCSTRLNTAPHYHIMLYTISHSQSILYILATSPNYF